MSLFSVIKKDARLALQGSWGAAILVFLIPLAVDTVLFGLYQILLSLSALRGLPHLTGETIPWFLERLYRGEQSIRPIINLSAGFFVGSPLLLGAAHWHYSLIHGQSPSVKELFRFFRSVDGYLRSLGLSFQLAIRGFLWSFLLFLPSAVLGGASYFFLASYQLTGIRAHAAMATLGMLVSVLFSLVLGFLLWVILAKYSLAVYLLCEDDRLSAREAIRVSCLYTKGFRFSLVLFQLSFLGWFLLTVIGFCLPALYLSPYFNTSFALYARYIVEHNRRAPANSTREFLV